MNIYQYLLDKIEENGACHLILLDPDKLHGEQLRQFVSQCASSGVDGFLIGGSLLMNGNLDETLKEVRKNTNLPLIIFPGSVNQVSKYADAILFISLLSGRNPEHLIGKHVIAAPLIKNAGIEPISTGYLIVESGTRTTAEYMSGSLPIPRRKPEIAVATALAAQYLGMKLVYLEAGSGADEHVPVEMVKAVSSNCDIPLIVGGGIRNAETAATLVRAGAKIIVTGNFFEKDSSWNKLNEFTSAVHYKKSSLA
jgi:putative glycerol-1-phosphate prenyltransferase